MSNHVTTTDLTGGSSVYCINQYQMREAARLAREDASSAPKISAALEQLTRTLSRNEQAALAFVLIEQLAHSHSSGTAA